jgi:hypothetical protein
MRIVVEALDALSGVEALDALARVPAAAVPSELHGGRAA